MTRPPGEGRARPVVSEGGPWKGIDAATWVARIAAASTPRRELVDDGSFRSWIDPESRRGAA